MNQKLNRRIQFIRVLIFIVIILGVIAFSIYIFWKLIEKSPINVSTTIIVASSTVLLSIITLIISKSWERKLNIENEMRLKKIPIYEEFMTFWFKNIFSINKENKIEPLSQDEIVRSMGTFTEKIIIWGSDSVIKNYSNFRQFSFNADRNDEEHMKLFIILFEQLLFSIRKDLGHKNYGLKTGDIISLFMTDFHKLFNYSRSGSETTGGRGETG